MFLGFRGIFVAEGFLVLWGTEGVWGGGRDGELSGGGTCPPDWKRGFSSPGYGSFIENNRELFRRQADVQVVDVRDLDQLCAGNPGEF